MYSQDLKKATKVYYESEKNFEKLLYKVRSEEYELRKPEADSKKKSTGARAQHNPIQGMPENQIETLTKLCDRIDSIEKKLQTPYYKRDNYRGGRGGGRGRGSLVIRTKILINQVQDADNQKTGPKQPANDNKMQKQIKVSIKGQTGDNNKQSLNEDINARLVGDSNESIIPFCGKRARALIDSGSQVTTMSEMFYDSLHNKPDLLNLSDFNLTITRPDGRSIPYLGLIEVTVKADFMQGKEVKVLVLIMPNTDYSQQVPIIVGTYVIRLYQALYSGDSEVADIPPQWKAVFMAIQDDYAGTVRSTNKSLIEIQPMETITVSGLVQKQKNIDSAVTEPTDRASSKLGICPRIVTLNKPGKM